MHSKMARRLMRQYITLTALPLIITVLTLQHLGHEQILWTGDTMRRINQEMLNQAGEQFEELGSRAVQEASNRAQATSTATIEAISQQLLKLQSDTMQQAAKEYANASSRALLTALDQSVKRQRAVLLNVGDKTKALIHQSAIESQKRAGGNVESAMMALNREIIQARALDIINQIQDVLHAAPQFLRLTSQMIDMSPESDRDREVKLDALTRRIPGFLRVSVINPQGQEITASAADRLITSDDLKNYAKASWFIAALGGHTFIGRAEADAEPGVPDLRIAVPIETYPGHVVGVLAARYSLEDVWNQIRSTRIGDTGFACVFDEQERPLLQPRPIPADALIAEATLPELNWHIVTVVPRSEAIKPIAALKSDLEQAAHSVDKQTQLLLVEVAKRATKDLEAKLTHISFDAGRTMQHNAQIALRTTSQQARMQARLHLATLQRAIRQQTEWAMQQSRQKMSQAVAVTARHMATKARALTVQAQKRADGRLSLLALLFTTLSCLITGFAAVVTANRIVRPVVRLSQAAAAIAEGDLDKRVEEDGPDEIGELAIAFNTMTASLQQSRNELQETQGQLVQSAKLASLGTLSAGVAHELNQPLAIIRGIAQQIIADDSLPEEIRADLEIIEGQTGRMVKIIRHLRTFCRMGTTDFSLVDVNEVIRNCFILVGAQLKAHNVEVDLQLSEGLPSVLGDANELEQVFLNLITNARDALEDRANALITIVSKVQNNKVVVEFRDNGPGIPDDVRPHIFDPFFTTKEAGKGTGLGLSISHSIIKRHQGAIDVRNDGGAVFTVTLPIPEQARMEMQEAA
ncbi:histidine kinase,HAMP domain-containing protein,histidine kinase [Chthonomonas calidirosea]|uniref:histidine kinase n=1 Tax=Chthonomonas calidirosea (strain DSM 23976 / ICMP 18418 / T49) TaxID=1303518 RepID=S0EWU5_CHTCT|nr:ATP-binding protein [Chthonomonas calidirosea]CCW36385.1 His Kinase A (phospho-acceptor) domain./HAMP domain./Histidine kinase-, DNA gyrase B-, and HSP90-like ATPase [Chthonomonas calidirosea T49]CEK17490.1 histidine kinase,HAMP domain-containing protein,histidine kinase [Chthonomonas calidirosea]